MPVLLAGEGASRFAGQIGAERALPHPFADKDTNEDDPACDTVGCIALDYAGHIAAATSTGGLTGKRPGPVGDACLSGGGSSADDPDCIRVREGVSDYFRCKFDGLST